MIYVLNTSYIMFYTTTSTQHSKLLVRMDMRCKTSRRSAAAAADPLAATRSCWPESGGRPQAQLPSFPRLPQLRPPLPRPRARPGRSPVAIVAPLPCTAPAPPCYCGLSCSAQADCELVVALLLLLAVVAAPLRPQRWASACRRAATDATDKRHTASARQPLAG